MAVGRKHPAGGVADIRKYMCAKATPPAGLHSRGLGCNIVPDGRAGAITWQVAVGRYLA